MMTITVTVTVAPISLSTRTSPPAPAKRGVGHVAGRDPAIEAVAAALKRLR
jgi:hypothetical protein